MIVVRSRFSVFVATMLFIIAASLVAPSGALAAFLKAEMAPIMFVSLIFFLLMGYPVAFSLSAIGFLIVVNIVIFLLAFFLDFFELAFIVIPLLVKPAEALGIDLIWFGVLLGVNMQTSFMHPPFGFALFYLRSVAPEGKFVDKVTGKLTDGITTAQIYWGAVPFVVIQVIMVGLVIAFPGMVTAGLDKGNNVDPSKVKIELQAPSTDEPPPVIFAPPKN